MDVLDMQRLDWLRSNPTATYRMLPQGLWDSDRISLELRRQNEGQGFRSPDPGELGACDCHYPVQMIVY